MKKVLLSLLLIFVCNVALFAQITIKLENFDGVIPPSLPLGVTSAGADWQTDNTVLPACTVAGSSSVNVLAGTNQSGLLEEVIFGPYNATSYNSMIVSWNGYRTSAGGPAAAVAPALSLSYSTDGVTYTNIPFTDVATDDVWHALTAVAIPTLANNTPSLSIKLSYTSSMNGGYLAIEDWLLQGFQTPTYYWDGTGFLNNLNSWSLNTNGIGVPHPTDFASANQVFNIVNGVAATINGAWSVSGNNAKVFVGNGTTWNPNFTVPAGFVFSVASGSMLTVSSNATLTLQNTTLPTTSLATFSVGSTIDYAQASPVNIIGVTHSNLTISGGANKNQSGSLTVNGILNLNGSNIVLPNSAFSPLNISGTVIGSGDFQTTTNSKINITGTGAFGTVTFSSTTSPIICGTLIMNRTASGSLVLGSDVQVNSAFTQTNGTINLNGKTLTLNGAVTFPAAISNGSLKGSSTSVLNVSGAVGAITGSLLMDQTSSSTRSLLALIIGNAAKSITLGNALEILDSVKVSAGTLACAGNLTLKSTAALKARIAQIGGTVSGNINVETYIPGTTAGWRTLGPSGISGLTVANWDGGAGSATSFAMTCSGCTYGVNSAGGYFVSIQSDPAGNGTYTELTSSSALTPGTGYWVYDGNSTTTAINITQTTSGPVVTGNVASGTGFMANPYPSPISIDRLKTHTAITQVDLYNENTGTYTSYNGGIPSSGVIPMGQGFYATGASNITFQESDKVSFNTGSYSVLKTASSSTIGTVFQLNVAGASSGDFDQTYIRFHGNATPTFDNDLDAYKRFATPGYLGYPGAYSQYTTINTLASNMDYAINSLPYATTSNVVIPVRVKVSITGTYSIMPVGVANLPATACITLKDKLLNVTHDLRTGAYVCSINDTTSAPRFELTICADITTGINNSAVTIDNTLINQDVNGAYVKTNFETNTKATISAYNVMGQKLMADKEIEGKDLTTYLDLGDVHSQVVIIIVATAKTNTTKKIFIN